MGNEHILTIINHTLGLDIGSNSERSVVGGETTLSEAVLFTGITALVYSVHSTVLSLCASCGGFDLGSEGDVVKATALCPGPEVTTCSSLLSSGEGDITNELSSLPTRGSVFGV